MYNNKLDELTMTNTTLSKYENKVNVNRCKNIHTFYYSTKMVKLSEKRMAIKYLQRKLNYNLNNSIK